MLLNSPSGELVSIFSIHSCYLTSLLLMLSITKRDVIHHRKWPYTSGTAPYLLWCEEMTSLAAYVYARKNKIGGHSVQTGDMAVNKGMGLNSSKKKRKMEHITVDINVQNEG